jgi:hypothetical protein
MQEVLRIRPVLLSIQKKDRKDLTLVVLLQKLPVLMAVGVLILEIILQLELQVILGETLNVSHHTINTSLTKTSLLVLCSWIFLIMPT